MPTSKLRAFHLLTLTWGFDLLGIARLTGFDLKDTIYIIHHTPQGASAQVSLKMK